MTTLLIVLLVWLVIALMLMTIGPFLDPQFLPKNGLGWLVIVCLAWPLIIAVAFVMIAFTCLQIRRFRENP